MVANRIAGRMLRSKPNSSIPGVSFPWLRPRRRLSFAPDRVPARPSRTELVKVAHFARPGGLDLYKFEHDGSLGASGRNPGLRTQRPRSAAGSNRNAKPSSARRQCYRRMQSLGRPLHHRPSVKDRNPHGRRRALRAAPGRPFGAVGPDPAPSRGGTPKWFGASDTNAKNSVMMRNVTYAR